MEEPDPVAIRAAAAGDVAAFEQLVRAYQAPVWRFLRHLLGDPDLALDVTQDTFVRAYRRLDTFRFQSKFSTWLLQIARNAGVDAIRRNERHLRALHAAPAPPPPADAAASSELREALAHLSPKGREALLLVEVVGLTYREAGSVLGVPEGTVKSRVHSARERLVDWYAAGEPGADKASGTEGGAP